MQWHLPVKEYIIQNINTGKEYHFTDFEPAERAYKDACTDRPEAEYRLLVVLNTSALDSRRP